MKMHQKTVPTYVKRGMGTPPKRASVKVSKAFTTWYESETKVRLDARSSMNLVTVPVAATSVRLLLFGNSWSAFELLTAISVEATYCMR